ncbi:MAG: CBS domain-containing protein [Chloroflexi bacterium]|nr:CBS domain-containing protein [Chloroflexota bacterium]
MGSPAAPAPSGGPTLTARDIMSAPPISIGPEATVEKAARLMLDRDIGCLPVVDAQGRVVGIITETNLVPAAVPLPEAEHKVFSLLGMWVSASEEVLEAYQRARTLPVKQVMSHEVVAVTRDTPIPKLASLMLEKGVRHLVVVDGGKLVGIVARRDLLKCLAPPPEGHQPPA